MGRARLAWGAAWWSVADGWDVSLLGEGEKGWGAHGLFCVCAAGSFCWPAHGASVD
jgi:hypothetical protein